MQVQQKINSATIVTVEGETTSEVFQQLAKAFAVFGVGECGACESKDIYPNFRSGIDKEGTAYSYHEMKCASCYSTLSYGLGKDKEIYPKTFEVDKKGKQVKTDDGKPVRIENKGWTKYSSS